MNSNSAWDYLFFVECVPLIYSLSPRSIMECVMLCFQFLINAVNGRRQDCRFHVNLVWLFFVITRMSIGWITFG